MLIDLLAKMAKIRKFCLANSLLYSPMATWLTITGTQIYVHHFVYVETQFPFFRPIFEAG